MMISNNAKKIFEVIKAAGGGIIDEYIILRRSDLSHGSFSAARKELTEAGLLTIGKEGRKTVYIINSAPLDADNKTDVKTDVKSSASVPPAKLPQKPVSVPRPLRRPTGKAFADVSVSRMKRITGTFADIDDWEDALISRLGGCVDVNDCGDGEHYEVYSHDLDETARYTVSEGDDGIVVR